MSRNEPGQAGPLAGVHVLDMTTVQMGPLATVILADMGADVIKVESPDGDISRQSYPSRNKGMGHSFMTLNRNKRSVALDVKQPEGRAALLKLAERADVFVYNVRPQAMARLKLDYEDLKKVNEQIIYVAALGFSQRGRYGGRPAYDTVIQGMSGIPWMAAHASGHEPRYAPYSQADQSSGLHLTIGILAALYHRKATGRGQRVDVPMFENLVHVLLNEHLAGELFVPPMGNAGYARQLSRDRHPYQTKDGWLCPFIYNDKQWRTFFRIIDQPDRMDTDERFSSHANRVKNIDTVYGLVEEVLKTRTTEEWTRVFQEHDLPVGPMNSMDDVLVDPHLSDVGYFQEREHPSEGRLRETCYPTEFLSTPSASTLPAPRLGEHTIPVLMEAGYDRAEIDALIEKRAAVAPADTMREPQAAT